ncbi:MAG: ABC transporter substrate-binding protein [Propionibacteriaceae bacterium]|jgi:polar amino acid transport system substrate-binding protein|nr:ABC transporter substrate-binding protein [Propionibacteriaceae bacterium]
MKRLFQFVIPLMALSLAACSAQSAPTTSEPAPADEPSSAAAPAITTLKEGVITAMTMTDGAPFASIQDDKWTGYEIALLEKLAGNLGLSIEFTGREFDTLIPTVAGGQADICFVSIADTDKRREMVDFTLPDYTGTNNVVVTNDSPIPNAEQQIGVKVGADVTGKRVGVQQASMGLEYAKAYFTEAELVTYPNNNAAIAGLTSGNVDSIVIDGQSAYLFEEQFPVHTAFTTIDPANRGAAIVINKERTALREALNAELRKALADGTIQALLEEYNPKEPAGPVVDFLKEYYANFPNDTYPY